MVFDMSLTKWCVVLIYALTSTVGTTGFYLCITEQGNLRVEQGWGDKCLAGREGKSDIARVQTLALIPTNSSCGACADINVSLGPHTVSDTKTETLSVTDTTAMTFMPTEPPPPTAENRINETISDPGGNSTLFALRTVILLI